MRTMEDFGLLVVAQIPLVVLALWVRGKLPQRPTLAGGLIVLAAVIGATIGIVLVDRNHKPDYGLEIDEVIGGRLKAECAKPPGDSDDQRAIHELSCARDVHTATLTGSGEHAAIRVDINLHGELFAALLPDVDTVAGKTYVVWLLDRSGNPIAHLSLESKPFLYTRDPRAAAAVEAEITLETAPGAAPSGPVVARGAFVGRWR